MLACAGLCWLVLVCAGFSECARLPSCVFCGCWVKQRVLWLGSKAPTPSHLPPVHLHPPASSCLRPPFLAPPAARDVRGGTVQMVVHYAGLPIWTQVDSLCDKADCPIKKGPTEVGAASGGGGEGVAAARFCGMLLCPALGSAAASPRTTVLQAFTLPACTPPHNAATCCLPPPASTLPPPAGALQPALPLNHPSRLLHSHPERPLRGRLAVLRHCGLPGGTACTAQHSTARSTAAQLGSIACSAVLTGWS